MIHGESGNRMQVFAPRTEYCGREKMPGANEPYKLVMLDMEAKYIGV